MHTDRQEVRARPFSACAAQGEQQKEADTPLSDEDELLLTVLSPAELRALTPDERRELLALTDDVVDKALALEPEDSAEQIAEVWARIYARARRSSAGAAERQKRRPR
jgi:hypothetical protein